MITPEEIRALRLKLKLSAKAFGHAVGLTGKHADRTVRRWECGDMIPSGPARKNIKQLEDRESK